MSIDIYIDPLTGDLPDTTRSVEGLDLVRQRIRVRLQRGLGEWFLDPANVGLPLIAWRETRPTDPDAIAAGIAAEIQSTPGVLAVADFEGAHDHAARSVTVSGRVQYDDGTVEAVQVVRAPDTDHNTMWLIGFTASGTLTGGIPSPTIGSL